MAQGVHSKCMALAAEALEVLQDKKQPLSTAIRKLELCAQLLGDEELQRWCDFHLGAYVYKLPHIAKDQEVTQQHYDTAVKTLTSLGAQITHEEIVPRLFQLGGGFGSVEAIEEHLGHLQRLRRENDWQHSQTRLLRTITSCRNAASRRASKLYAAFAFGDIPRRQFDVIRERVDDLLLDTCPEAIEKFMTAYERLGSSSSEDWSLALTECRRVIKAVADSLFAPSGDTRANRKLGEEQYINRLWAFLDDQIEVGSDANLAKAHIDYLGSFMQRLNDKASKGVHSNVTYEEAVRAVLYTYLTLGDILELAGERLPKASGTSGRVDLNSAPLDDLKQVPGITARIAKEIIKKRVSCPFESVDQLLDIPGVGPGTLEKVRGSLRASK